MQPGEVVWVTNVRAMYLINPKLQVAKESEMHGRDPVLKDLNI